MAKNVAQFLVLTGGGEWSKMRPPPTTREKLQALRTFVAAVVVIERRNSLTSF